MRLVSGDSFIFAPTFKISVKKPGVVISFSRSEMQKEIGEKLNELIKEYLDNHRIQ